MQVQKFLQQKFSGNEVNHLKKKDVKRTYYNINLKIYPPTRRIFIVGRIFVDFI